MTKTIIPKALYDKMKLWGWDVRFYKAAPTQYEPTNKQIVGDLGGPADG